MKSDREQHTLLFENFQALSAARCPICERPDKTLALCCYLSVLTLVTSRRRFNFPEYDDRSYVQRPVLLHCACPAVRTAVADFCQARPPPAPPLPPGQGQIGTEQEHSEQKTERRNAVAECRARGHPDSRRSTRLPHSRQQ